MANAAAHGIAAAVLMGVSSGVRRRCQAMAAVGITRGGTVLPPCVPDAQLAAALPAIRILVKAQVHLHLESNSCQSQPFSCAEFCTWP